MNKQKGYTLVELLLAIAILGMIGLIFNNFVLSYQENLILLENKAVANNLARLKAEEFRDNGLKNNVQSKQNQFQQEEFVDYSYTVKIIKRRADLKGIKLKIYYLEKEIFSLYTFV